MTTFHPPWKKLMLGAYYYASLPGRRWWNARVSRAGRAPVMVIYYHRVADHAPNDWTMSRQQFTREMDWLQDNFDLVSLDEAQRRLREGNYHPSVSITFDDGYADNCDYALPLLIDRRIPCTYFVTSQYVLAGEAFPHDVTRGISHAPNSVADLRSLAAAGIEIGGHTRTHADLGQMTDVARLRDEIVGGRQDLEDALGCPLRFFAIPYGQRPNLNAATFQVAWEGGFAGVCSAYGGYNLPGDDAFHLQRIAADGDLLRLKNWLTCDPRKLHRQQRFLYQGCKASS